MTHSPALQTEERVYDGVLRQTWQFGARERDWVLEIHELGLTNSEANTNSELLVICTNMLHFKRHSYMACY